MVAVASSARGSALRRAPQPERAPPSPTGPRSLSPVDGYEPRSEPPEEAEAIEVMRRALAPTPERAAIREWVLRVLGGQARGKPVSVLGHTALLFLLREGTFAEDARGGALVASALAASWLKFTGERREGDALLERLPRRVLRTATRQARSFHAATFQSAKPGERPDPAVGKDYVPMRSDVGLVLAALAALTTTLGAQLIGGGLIGFVIASFLESYLHKNGGHASQDLRAMASQSGWRGWIGRRLAEAHFSHTMIHHGKTFRADHVTQFRDEDEQKALDTELRARGPSGEEVIEERYGLTIKDANVPQFLQPYAATAVAVAIGLQLAPAAVMGMTLPLLMAPCTSKYMHPYDHMKRAEALKSAGPFMRWLLQTRYAEMMSRLHYVHHRGGGGNENLLPPLGDIMLGRYRKPNVKQLLEMRDLEMIY